MVSRSPTVDSSIADVAVVSAFGRGHWLAVELAEKGFKVDMVDISESLGRWTPEDCEGPFGFFQSEKVTPSQLTRLTFEDYHETVDDGFAVWTSEGVVDTKGPLSGFWLSQDSALAKVHRHLHLWDQPRNQTERVRWMEGLASLEFNKSWLVHLAHQLASNVFLENAYGARYGSPLPLFSSYFIRRVTRRGYLKSLDWCREKGVRVFSSSKVTDLSGEKRSWHSLEVKGEWSGALRAKNLVWMTSSAEAHKIASRVGEFLFPEGPAQPEWVWIRYRINIDASLYQRTLPTKVVLIEDPRFWWTHGNFLVLQKTVKEDDFDCWMRIPAHARFHRTYLQERADEIVALLNKKMPFSKTQILDMPQDFHYEHEDLGPSLFPVFSAETLKKFNPASFKNVYFSSAEFGDRLDWTGRFAQQQKIFEQLMAWKQKETQKKEAQGDRQVHAT